MSIYAAFARHSLIQPVSPARLSDRQTVVGGIQMTIKHMRRELIPYLCGSDSVSLSLCLCRSVGPAAPATGEHPKKIKKREKLINWTIFNCVYQEILSSTLAKMPHSRRKVYATIANANVFRVLKWSWQRHILFPLLLLASVVICCCLTAI